MTKQQVISRFFAPKSASASPKTDFPSTSSPPLRFPPKPHATFSSPQSLERASTLRSPSQEIAHHTPPYRALDDLSKLPQPHIEASPTEASPFLYHRKRTRTSRIDKQSSGGNKKQRSLRLCSQSVNDNRCNSGMLESIVDDDSSSAFKDDLAFPPVDPKRHKKFVEKLLVRTERDGAQEQCGTLNKEKHTPLEQQVVELKAKYKDVVLIVEVGYKYRFFGEDAEIAAKILGIFAHYDHNFLTASIPTFRLHVHVRRLVEAGYKVGVVRQTETAALKAHTGNKVGPFSRTLSALYTRATLEAAEDLGGGKSEGCRMNNYLMAVVEKVDLPKMNSKKTSVSQPAKEEGKQEAEGSGKETYDTTIGIVAVETATGDVMFGELKDTIMRSELESCLLACSPAELLLATPLSSATEKLLLEFAGPASNVRVERVINSFSDSGGAVAKVLAFYERSDSAKHSGAEANNTQDKEIEAIIRMPELAVQALALALKYLKDFGLEKILHLGSTFRPFANSGEMNLSSNCLRQLEILQTNADGTEKGSLLWLMNHTQTAFGARLFRHWLAHPLRDQVLISARLDAVSEIAASLGSIGHTHNEGSFPGSGRGGGSATANFGCMLGTGKHSQGVLASVLASLKKVPDLERGITRIFHRTATAAEFVAVIHALITTATQLQRLCVDDEDDSRSVDASAKGEFKRAGSQLLDRLLKTASSSIMIEHARRSLLFLNKEAALAGDKHNLFVCACGSFPEVSNYRASIQAAESRLDSFLPSYRKLLRMPSLQYSNVSGVTYLLEVPVMQHVPSNWIKINSTQKVYRYHTPEVLEALESLAVAQETLTVECNKSWDAFLEEFSVHYVDFRAAVQAIAALDCLYSLALVSRNHGYTRPEFVEPSESSQLIIEGGRHPVLETVLQDGFVPNDTLLQSKREYCQIITGPNMGGKSCYVRQVALIAIMAQIGSYVPAAKAKLCVLDAIYSRLGASDSIQRGSSTFLEELSEASTILKKATSNSLVIIDELGRGTSTHDGAAIAYATLHHLITQTCCLTLFVTHYPMLGELTEKYQGKVGSYYVSYLAEEPLAQSKEVIGASLDDKESTRQNRMSEGNQKITFLYKLVPGVASRSFGLHVARLAQVPELCLQRAADMASKLEIEVTTRANINATSAMKLTADCSRCMREVISNESKIADEYALNGRGSTSTVVTMSFPTSAACIDAKDHLPALCFDLEADDGVRKGNKEVVAKDLESIGDKLNEDHLLKMYNLMRTICSTLELPSEKAVFSLRDLQNRATLFL